MQKTTELKPKCSGNQSDTPNLFCSEDNSIPLCHSDVEILYILDGTIRISVDFNLYDAKKGDVVLIFPEQIHKVIAQSETEKHLHFVQNPNITPEYSEIFEKSLPVSPIITDINGKSRLDYLFNSFDEFRKTSDNKFNSIQSKGFLLTLYGEIFNCLSFRKRSRSDLETLKRILIFCRQHHNENITLDMVENHLGISKFYISRLFSGKIKLSFNDYINCLRVADAEKLLAFPYLKINRICEKVGFNSQRTFDRAFIKIHKISPSAYRKNLQ